jgi:hypothetical protein
MGAQLSAGKPSSAPPRASGLSIVLQGATADVDAEYQQIDATTNAQVKLAALPPCKRNFCESSSSPQRAEPA